MTAIDVRIQPEQQHDVQLAFEALNDWYIALDQLDVRRPWFFSVMISSWFATVATGFEPSRNYLIWLIGGLGIVAIWFGAVSFFLVYATNYLHARKIEKQIGEAVADLKNLGLKYVRRTAKREAYIVHAKTGQPIDPYDDSIIQ